MKIFIVAFLVTVCAQVQPVLAQKKTLEEIAKTLPTTLLRNIQKNPNVIQQRISQQLFKLGADGVATPERIKIGEEVRFAKMRMGHMQVFMTQDLNGDGQVTAEEFETTLFAIKPDQRATASVFRLEADSDKNGVVTYIEAARNAERRMARTSWRSKFAVDVMAFDLNGNGRVDVAEASTAIEEIAKLIEANPSLLRRKVRAKSPSCNLPRAPNGVKVVVLSGYEGDAVSTVTVNGQDQTTSVAEVTIEPGKEPLWIFATAFDPIIWKINGAIERINHFVAQPYVVRTGGHGIGVVGLKKEKVSFVPAGACMPYLTKATDGKAQIEMAKMATRIAHPVDKLIAYYSLAGVGVPSGHLARPKVERFSGTIVHAEGRRFLLTSDGVVPLQADMDGNAKNVIGIDHVTGMFKRFTPGGIVDIAPKDVVAPGKVERYEVLPQEAGLLQLMRTGALKRTKDGYFLIRKPIPRFPAGLAGAHGVKFILGKGVAMPAGGGGHSRVYSEMTGECLKGAECQR